MRHFTDLFLVGLALLASAAYALFALGPKRLSSRAAASIADLAARAAAIPALRGTLRRLSVNLANKAQSSCGGCDNCGSDAAAKVDPTRAESRIPVSMIGLRRRSRR